MFRFLTRSAIAVALLAACRYQPTPVQLQGTPADISALAGKWEGEYSSSESGRSGSITFEVQPGKDTAYGDVLMVPEHGQPIIATDADSRAHAMHSRLPELLRVTFVRVRNGFVDGTLESYIAPDCQCPVSTVFHGVLEGKVINGKYVTYGATSLRQSGSWSVSRKP